MNFLNQVVQGDAAQVLQTFPEASVDCLVTSPPYFQQRDYQDPRQIGQEPTPEAYIDALLSVFDQAFRVLKTTGTLWVNLGDKYKQGRLLGMPWRFALAMNDANWILRSDIIWHKPNAMPSAVKNRPTTDHEYLFLFSRSHDYFYDTDAVRQPHVTFSSESKMKGGRKHLGHRNSTPEQGKNSGSSNLHDGRWDQAFHPKGRNRRTVWSIPLSKNRQAHFAVFPESLVETCIKAGCPQDGVVLDPFAGTGTTLRVARRLQRNFVGIDCRESYCEMARQQLLLDE